MLISWWCCSWYLNKLQQKLPILTFYLALLLLGRNAMQSIRCGLLLSMYCAFCLVPSVLWRSWLGSRKGIWPVKTEWWGAGVVICLEWGADMHMAQLMPLPLTVSCFSKIEIGFTFLVPAHLGSPGKRAVKRVCVCVCIMVCLCVCLLDTTVRPAKMAEPIEMPLGLCTRVGPSNHTLGGSLRGRGNFGGHIQPHCKV